jgi:Tripartite tricarboxylate transporter family receptor
VGDFVPGYEASAWYGIGAPRETPDEIINKLNKEINTILTDPRSTAARVTLGRAMRSFVRKFPQYALTGGKERKMLYLYEPADPISAMCLTAPPPQRGGGLSLPVIHVIRMTD